MENIWTNPRSSAFGGLAELTTLKCVRLSSNATLPTRATPGSAGLDLYAAAPVYLLPNQRVLVPTDLQILVPPGYCGRITSRSGQSYSHNVDVITGLLDADYTGNVGVLLHNFGLFTYFAPVKTKIAQIVIDKICYPSVQEVSALPTTDRGACGFGSTG